MKSLLLPLAAAFLVSPAFAQDSTEPALPEVVITATRTAQTTNEALASVTVISREQLERHPGRDVGDVLRAAAGLDVARSGGLGQQTSIFMRGAESDHTLVMIDGVRLNTGSAGLANIQNLALDAIERIEVVRGPRSTLYGSDAIGGVINIITRHAESDTATLKLAAGTDHFANASLRQARKTETTDVSVGVAGLYTNGNDIITDTPIDRGHQRQSFDASVGRNFAMGRLSATVREDRGTTEYLTDVYNSSFTARIGSAPLSQDFLQRLAQAAGELKAGPWQGKLRLSQLEDHERQNQGPDFARTLRTEADWQNDFALGDHLLTAGGTYTDSAVDAMNFGAPYEADLDNRAAYLQEQFEWHAFSARAGARNEHHERFGSHNTWDLGLGYALTGAHRLYADWGSGFRAPSGGDLYGLGGNPRLEPEKSRSTEVGSKHELGNWSLNTALFDTRITNLITFGPGFQLFNVAATKIRGAELGADWQSRNWYAHTQASYLRPRNVSSGTDLLRRPRRSLSTEAGFQTDTWNLGAGVVAKSRAQDFGGIGLPGYASLNLHAGYVLRPGARLSLDVENLLDKTYSQAAVEPGVFYVAQRRAAMLSLTLSL